MKSAKYLISAGYGPGAVQIFILLLVGVKN